MESQRRILSLTRDSDVELTSHLLEEETTQNTPSPLSENFIPQLEISEKDSSSESAIPHLGIAMAIASSFCFSVCSLIVKEMNDMHPVALAMYRFIGIVIPTLPILWYKKAHPFPKGKRLMLVLRAFLGCTSLMSQFYAIRYMPLADASVIIFSVPVFVAVFARIFLKEHFGIFHFFTILTTLIGCTLIARPPFVFGNGVAMTLNAVSANFTNITTVQQNNTQNSIDSYSVSTGAIVALVGTIFAANVYVVIRALKDLHFSVIMTSFGCFAFVQTFIVTLALGELHLPPQASDWYMLLLLAIFSFGGQILLTMALHREQAGPVSIARSTDIIFAFVWQITVLSVLCGIRGFAYPCMVWANQTDVMVFFHEVPTWLSVLGALLVTCSVLLVGAKKWAEGLPNSSAAKRRLRCLLY